MNSLSSSAVSLKFLPFSPAAFPQDQICSIVGHWLLLSRWLFFLLILQIVAYHDFPWNWLLSISSSSKWAAGKWNVAALGLEESSSVSIKPLPPSRPVETGLFETAKFPPWLTVPKAPCQGVPSHEPPAQGMIPWQSTTQAVLKGPIIPCYSSSPCPVSAQIQGLGLSRAAAWV